MPKPRRRRWLRRALIALAIVVVGLVVFTWIAFWPLEGDVEEITSLVPADVDFVYRASWKGLEDTGWLQENLHEHPFLPQIAQGLEGLDRQLAQLEANEKRINEQIPLGITTFSFEDDVFGKEVIAAGRFCEGWDPSQGPPRWRELLFLTRISWKTRFFSALKHGFVRDQLQPDVTVTDEGNDVFKFVVNPAILRPGTLQERSGCGPGIVVPPMNVWYGRRVKDVLVFSNSESLMRDVDHLVEFPESGRSYLDRPWVRLDAPPNTVAASIDLQPLEHYLARTLEIIGSPYTILRRYLTVTALDRMNGQLILPSRDLVLVQGEVKYQPPRLGPGVGDVYELRAEPLSTGAAALLPAEDTFAALLLRTPPLQLIEGIYEEILTPGDRKLWENNLRTSRMPYDDIHAFFREFASQLSDTAMIAVGRISDTFDAIDYDEFYPQPVEKYPSPEFPALTIAIRLNQSTLPEDLDAYLAERMPLLGASEDLQKVEYRGLTYTKVRLELKTADYAVVEPAYILAQNHFIYSSSEKYFRKLLDTMVDARAHPPLAADPTYRSTIEHLDVNSHLTFFLDLEKLFQAPEDRRPGGTPRGFLWDQRNLWVIANRNADQEGMRFRQERVAEVSRRSGRPPTQQQMAEIYRQEDAYVEDWRRRYPDFEEEYREHLAGYDRLKAFGVSIRADRPSLHLAAALLLERAAATVR